MYQDKIKILDRTLELLDEAIRREDPSISQIDILNGMRIQFDDPLDQRILDFLEAYILQPLTAEIGNRIERSVGRRKR